jgi:hypothetical protein
MFPGIFPVGYERNFTASIRPMVRVGNESYDINATKTSLLIRNKFSFC